MTQASYQLTTADHVSEAGSCARRLQAGSPKAAKRDGQPQSERTSVRLHTCTAVPDCWYLSEPIAIAQTETEAMSACYYHRRSGGAALLL